MKQTTTIVERRGGPTRTGRAFRFQRRSKGATGGRIGADDDARAPARRARDRATRARTMATRAEKIARAMPRATRRGRDRGRGRRDGFGFGRPRDGSDGRTTSIVGASAFEGEMAARRIDAKTFDAVIERACDRGRVEALREVDARLSEATRAETRGARDGDASERTAAMDRAMRAEAEAVAIIECLRQRGEISAFGRCHNVPKRDYTLAELKLNNIEAEKLLAPTESTIKGIRDNFTRLLVAAYVGGVVALHPTFAQGAGVAAFATFCSVYDQVAFAGGVSALALDTVAQSTSKEYVTRLRRHEAAHFLTAYLIGILPKGYTLSSLDAFRTYGAFNIQAGCAFCDGEFQEEVRKGKISSTSLGKFACVAMAGICMEYILFGFAEGGLSDVQQLDGLLRALAFSQKKSDSEVRWAVLNTTALLRRHVGLTEKLAEIMARGASVGECVALIETEMQTAALI